MLFQTSSKAVQILRNAKKNNTKESPGNDSSGGPKQIFLKIIERKLLAAGVALQMDSLRLGLPTLNNYPLKPQCSLLYFQFAIFNGRDIQLAAVPSRLDSLIQLISIEWLGSIAPGSG